MRFCDVCESRLEDITTITELYYQCTKCKKRYPASDSDTLRFSMSFGKQDDSLKYDILLKNSAYDNVNPKIFKPCPKCDRQIVSYVIIGDNMRYVYLCVCGNKF